MRENKGEHINILYLSLPPSLSSLPSDDAWEEAFSATSGTWQHESAASPVAWRGPYNTLFISSFLNSFLFSSSSPSPPLTDAEVHQAGQGLVLFGARARAAAGSWKIAGRTPLRPNITSAIICLAEEGEGRGREREKKCKTLDTQQPLFESQFSLSSSHGGVVVALVDTQQRGELEHGASRSLAQGTAVPSAASSERKEREIV